MRHQSKRWAGKNETGLLSISHYCSMKAPFLKADGAFFLPSLTDAVIVHDSNRAYRRGQGRARGASGTAGRMLEVEGREED